jgi:hypothetical protein
MDMEKIIMNLHNKMKNLEGKYIDLANFYKKELVGKEDHYSPGRNYYDNNYRSTYSSSLNRRDSPKNSFLRRS